MINVHIVDDHRMLVQGLRLTIKESDNITVSGVSHTLAECRTTLAFETPDVLLLDLSLPDGSGIDFCTEVRKMYPSIKVLVLTSHDECSVARRVMENGASGYILKNGLSEEVVAGIEAVMDGETFLCDEINIMLKKQQNQPLWLTIREQEVMQLVANGYTNKGVADELKLSVETVKSYRKSALFKIVGELGGNTVEAINIARKKGWIK